MQEVRLKMLEHSSAVADSASGRDSFALKPSTVLPAAPLQAEAAFYSEYPWCLNAFPTIREVADHLCGELRKLDRAQEDWQQSEVVTNIFLLSCALVDTIDDYLAGSRYDFSKIRRLLPFANPGFRALEELFALPSRLRVVCLLRLRQWRESWAAAVTDFLRCSMIPADPERTILLQQRDRLAKLLPARLPTALWICRPKLPAFFRSRDFAPYDCFELGRKYLAAFPETDRPVLVLGLRTAGSYLAPLLCAYLSDWVQDVAWLTVRPRKGLTIWESARVRRAAQRKTRVLIVDESVHSGHTLAQAAGLLRHAGFADSDIVMLNPVEPAFPEWRNSRALQSLSKISVVTLEPAERYKQRLLESNAVEARLNEYFKAHGYVGFRTLLTSKTEGLNREWRTVPPERVDVRLKRVYEAHLKDATGAEEVRYVLAKSVGWGWLGYHAFIAGRQLAQFVPPILGLRDGILYTEWFPKAQEPTVFAPSRKPLIECLASYVAARARRLNLDHHAAPDLAREGRHKGFQMLADALSRAYGSRMVAALKRPRIQRELSRQNCPTSILTDSKMSRDEWIVAGPRLMKVDFEHHGQGKNELGMTDPAYDLAGAIFHFELSEEESEQLVCSYVRQSGDIEVRQRLWMNKLLAGLWAQNLATLGLENPRLAQRRAEFNERYQSAWNFLIAATARECGKLCQRPQRVCWHGPLVVADIDGVLDRMVFGFPSTTSAGVKAISLLHCHGFAIAVNTARSLQEVKLYCGAYGFAGGVAEYGSILWDAISERELALVGSEPLRQLQQVRNALQQIPGIFLNDNYRCSLRAFTYQNGRTMPLPPLLVQDLLADLKVDRLQVHHTDLDTAILAKETDKGAGLLSLLASVGMSSADVHAIGDSEPDLAMFRVARRSFAPGNISCRREAHLLGCHIVDLPYQPGLLQIAHRIVHPEGGACNVCRAVEASWPNGHSLLVEFLEIADQKPLSLLLRNPLDRSALAVFRK